MVFSTGVYEGDVSKFVKVITNDPAHPEIELTLSAHILMDFKLDPDGIMFRNHRRYLEFKKEIRVKGEKSSQIKITQIESRNEHIVGTVQHINENGRLLHVIMIQIKPGLPVGRVNEIITVLTDSPKYPRVQVPIHGEIIGNISVSPARVDLGFFTKETLPPEKVITVKMEKPGDRFDIQGIQDETGLFSHKVMTVQPGIQYQLILRVIPEIARKMIRSDLFILTNYPGEEKIKITVSGGVK